MSKTSTCTVNHCVLVIYLAFVQYGNKREVSMSLFKTVQYESFILVIIVATASAYEVLLSMALGLLDAKKVHVHGCGC